MAKEIIETNITLRYWGDDLSDSAKELRLEAVYEKIQRGETSGHGLEFYWEVKDSPSTQSIISQDLLKEIKDALEIYADPENWKAAKTGGMLWDGGHAPGFLSRKLLGKMNLLGL